MPVHGQAAARRAVLLGAMALLGCARGETGEAGNIDARAPGTTLTGNRATGNGDFGIDAVAGVTDGGGNTASGNGNAVQCRNVACGPAS